MILLAVPIIATSLWYLLSQAVITRWLWSRYPEWLDSWAQCPACSGTWLGAGTSAFLGQEFLGHPARSLIGLVLAGLWSLFGVSVGAWVLDFCLRTRGGSHEP